MTEPEGRDDVQTADAVAALHRAEERWVALSRHAQEIVAIVDERGYASFVNGGFQVLLGYDTADLVDHDVRFLAHPDDQRRPGGLDDLIAHPGHGRSFTREYRLRHADGTWRVFDVSVTDLRHEPSIAGFVLHGREVTQQVRAEEANRRLVEAVERSGAIVVQELERRSAEHAALAELGARALAGAPVGDLLEDACGLLAACLGVAHAHALLTDATGTQLELRAAFGPFRDDVGKTSRRVEDAWWTRASQASGRAIAVGDFDDEGAPMPEDLVAFGVRSGVMCALDGRDGLIGAIGVYAEEVRTWSDADVDFVQAVGNVLGSAIERQLVGEELRRRALHDDLTDLPNRALFVDRLGQALAGASRRSERVGLLFVDLDRFKRINDQRGHPAGDEVLMAVARRLEAATRPGDTVGRVGGDEFLVLCEDVDDEELSLIGQRLADAVAAPLTVGYAEAIVTASIGAALTEPGSHTEAESLVRDADLAMYRAKQLGRARVERFEVSMREAARSRLEFEEVVRDATTGGSLEVAFQPQVRMTDGAVVGVEALVRPVHPRLGALPVEEFVAVASELGLLEAITGVVLDAACRTTARIRRLVPELSVAVNFTARELASVGLAHRVAAVLAAHGLPPDALIIEVTETEVLDQRAVADALTELRHLGVRVSIDDFGTGYSSLARLTRLPADEVKIDLSFVAGLGRDKVADAIVRVAITLADALGLGLVAEGVEIDEQRDRLLALGCTVGQGWLFSGPLSATALEAWLETAPNRG
jgi:diguanylate cyclase (GGDEF)-like protein/PAS domain S-box-containing protein